MAHTIHYYNFILSDNWISLQYIDMKQQQMHMKPIEIYSILQHIKVYLIFPFQYLQLSISSPMFCVPAYCWYVIMQSLLPSLSYICIHVSITSNIGNTHLFLYFTFCVVSYMFYSKHLCVFGYGLTNQTYQVKHFAELDGWV